MTNVQKLFHDYLRTSPLAINNLVTQDSAAAPLWEEIFRAGFEYAQAFATKKAQDDAYEVQIAKEEKAKKTIPVKITKNK